MNKCTVVFIQIGTDVTHGFVDTVHVKRKSAKKRKRRIAAMFRAHGTDLKSGGIFSVRLQKYKVE